MVAICTLILCISFLLFTGVETVILTGRVDEARLENREIDPKKFDVLLHDLPVEKIKMKTSLMFRFEYNGYTTEPATFPINGVILKTTHERVVIPVIVAHKKKRIHTVCLVDTGSPYTYMSEETLRALNLEVPAGDDEFNLNVHGLPVIVYRSVNSFADINICGQSFFSEHKLQLTVNYRSRKAVAVKTADLTEEELEEL